MLDPSEPHSFTELGGDSLGAAALSALLEELYGVSIPVNTLLSPAGSPRQWARVIETNLRRKGDGTDSDTIITTHGEGMRQVSAKDLDIAQLLGRYVLDRASTAPRVLVRIRFS